MDPNAGVNMDRERGAPFAPDEDQRRLPTYDESVLLALLDGDAQLAAEVLSDFAAALRRASEEIEAAFRDGRTGDLVGVAHRLKSSSRTVGAMQLGELCERLEAAAGRGSPESLRQMMRALMAEIDAVSSRLDATGT
jgi:two-component system sensor histidine kinase/response regulator